MNILVIGAGAIGCLVAGKLAIDRHRVVLAGRPHFAARVREQGLVLIDGAARHRVETVTAVGSIQAAFSETAANYDLAIFTVKSYDTVPARDELVEAAAAAQLPLPPALSLQNGVGNEEALAAKLGSTQVIAGTITTPVSSLEPGVVQIDKPRYFVGISPWHPATPQSLLQATLVALQGAGFAAVEYPNAKSMKWTKLLMNMIGNATTAILDEPPEALFADPMLVDLEIDAWREALAVMSAAGIPPVNIDRYPFGGLGPLVRRTPKMILRPILRKQIGGARGGKLPSLHIDLHSGKTRSEVEWLNGAVVRKGKDVRVATPINQMLTETLLGLLNNPRQMELWRSDHMRFAVTAEEYRRQTRR